ncbi:MAG: hypothetical protein U9Q29_02795 [Campylobacterota bacterium]|nr:hypothetical protein [Campylobacterota bacterium]
MQNYCTLHELRTVYHLEDLYDFHECISLQEEAEYLAQREAQ